MSDSLENRLLRLEEYKNRQIDENRKISKRVDELEFRLCGLDHGTQNFVKVNVDNIHERIDEIESKISEPDDEELNVSYDCIRETASKWHKYFNMNTANKTPHKCPSCDGSTRKYIDPGMPMSGIESMCCNRDETGNYYKICHACEGKGIVWG